MYKISIIDGMSSDSTLEIANEWQRKNKNKINIFSNPSEWQASGRNIGIKNDLESNLISYIDGHCIADKNWLKNLYEVFVEKKSNSLAGVGSIIASPKDESEFGKVIDIIFSTPLGAAGSSYRPTNKIAEVRTVPYVLYLRSALEKVNFYDEDMKIGEDYSLNYKLIKAGYKLFVNPNAIIYYYKRKSFSGFLKQMYNYGYAKAVIAKKYDDSPLLYHYLPSVLLLIFFLLGMFGFLQFQYWILLFIGITIYLIAIISHGMFFSFKIKKINLLFFVPMAYLIEHFGYAIGFLMGFIKGSWKK